jgi:methyl-accepting chemotaxis protein
MNSIRVRLLVSLLAMLAAAALVMGGFTYRSVLAETETLFDYQLRQMALSLRDQGEIAPGQASTLADEQLDFVVQIWTVDGRSIYASRAHSTLPESALLGLADISVQGQTWRTFGVATPQRVIQVAQPRQIRQRLAANAALRSVAPLLLLAPLLALAIWWLAALTLAPLRRVAAGVRERDERSLQPLQSEGLPDEVAPLVQALNALLQRLGASLNTQRAFVADAAHELRSPLTALKLQLKLLQRAPDDAARAAATQALDDGITRAARLVEQLLTLAHRARPRRAGARRGRRHGALRCVARQHARTACRHQGAGER